MGAAQSESAVPEWLLARGSLRDKPSIAVLPFRNMSDDPEQDYFADGMVEDITAALSRIKWLFVTARSSGFIYKGKAVDPRRVGRAIERATAACGEQLGVRGGQQQDRGQCSRHRASSRVLALHR